MRLLTAPECCRPDARGNLRKWARFSCWEAGSLSYLCLNMKRSHRIPPERCGRSVKLQGSLKGPPPAAPVRRQNTIHIANYLTHASENGSVHMAIHAIMPTGGQQVTLGNDTLEAAQVRAFTSLNQQSRHEHERQKTRTPGTHICCDAFSGRQQFARSSSASISPLSGITALHRRYEDEVLQRTDADGVNWAVASVSSDIRVLPTTDRPRRRLLRHGAAPPSLETETAHHEVTWKKCEASSRKRFQSVRVVNCFQALGASADRLRKHALRQHVTIKI
ncbi:unnamed protein product [Rangifer tarandus platyrhynchus]|uniref:Uncharacterized protein n=1 Tax=Rangifer tarandus platyrhynchus TaxID=3082113 RepID=A0ABN8XNB5_RANTA|nr:unnamed protein product [Rangifer tarandus platyrhynchus]